jgi:hypothetical protein
MRAPLLHAIDSIKSKINWSGSFLKFKLYDFHLKPNMLQNFKNFFTLCQTLKARGNWPLIRKSKKQLWNFFICRNGLIKKSFFPAMIYWFHMLKGLEILIWRLETFGFLFNQRLNENDRKYLNQHLK